MNFYGGNWEIRRAKVGFIKLDSIIGHFGQMSKSVQKPLFFGFRSMDIQYPMVLNPSQNSLNPRSKYLDIFAIWIKLDFQAHALSLPLYKLHNPISDHFPFD